MAAADEQRRERDAADAAGRRRPKVAKRAKLLAKRAKLPKQLIAAIPMQQLQQAFESPTSAKRLWKLQRKHGFKESNKTIYMELHALFDERY